MDIHIDKELVRKKMKQKGFKTQVELAKEMGITKHQLSVILAKNYSPIKKNIQVLCEILDVDFIDILNIKKPYNIFDTNELMNLNEYIDVSNIVPKKTYYNVELFAGAGGLALGLEQAGFTTLGLLEKDIYACDTLRKNRPQWNVIQEDIINVTNEGIIKYLKDNDISIDLLTGGVPCQPFSTIGKRRGLDDDRGNMFYYFSEILEQLQPKIFMIENVKGLVTQDKGRALKTMIKTFSDKGYTTYYKILNSCDYGVAQRRERIIIVGIQNMLMKKYNIDYKFPKPYIYKPVLRDVMKNVPTSECAQYSEKKREILKLIPPGGNWRDLPEILAKDYLGNAYDGKGGKTGVARRMQWDEPCLTLTTNPSQKKCERVHPDETRPFTVREYARVQSFPDDWDFEGSMTQKYKQIGNAVPVELAKALGLSIIDLLNKIKKYEG